MWSKGAPTDFGVEVFTEGECWTLAYYLHKIGGWPVHVLHRKGEPRLWEHVVVKIGRNQYLDVNGVQTEKALVQQWRLNVNPLRESFTTWLEYWNAIEGCHVYDRPRERARVMAKRLVETYVHVT